MHDLRYRLGRYRRQGAHAESELCAAERRAGAIGVAVRTATTLPIKTRCQTIYSRAKAALVRLRVVVF
jgi:hypothetical protein